MKNLSLSGTFLLFVYSSVTAYELIDLGAYVEPRDINNLGVIVGSGNTDQYPPTAFRWSSTGGYQLIDGTSANAVNENGAIAGSTITGAFILDGTSYLEWNDFGAFAINQGGAAAGYKTGVNPVEPASLPYNPAIYDGTAWSVFDIAETYPRGTEEGVYADRFILNGMNDSGYSVGYKYRYGLFGSIAILIDPATEVKDKSDIVYLSIPEGGKASAINNSNMIVGTTGSNSRITPVAYRNAYLLDYNTGSLTILPLLEGGLRSSANDVNAYNQVVGFSETFDGSVMVDHAFLWNAADGVTVDLNDWAKTGWVLTSATAINDHGDIVGIGTLNGVEHGFLLSMLPTGGPVPEPPPSPSQNELPVANDINVAVDPGSSLNINVLANAADSDGDLNAASVVVAEAPAHGSTVVISNGTIQYTPDAGYEGTDGFSYTVKDDEGAVSNVASVNIAVKSSAVTVSDQAPADAAGGGALGPMLLVWFMSLLAVRRLHGKGIEKGAD